MIGWMAIRHLRRVSVYVVVQGRFRHLFNKDDARAIEELAHIQALADHNIKHYDLLGEGMDRLDSDGADTVNRGGMRWA